MHKCVKETVPRDEAKQGANSGMVRGSQLHLVIYVDTTYTLNIPALLIPLDERSVYCMLVALFTTSW
jgi:hypothetical protein